MPMAWKRRTLRAACLSAANKRHGSTSSPYERRQRSSDGRRRWWSRSSTFLSRATASYEALRGLEVLSVEDGRARDILSLWSGQRGEKCLLVFLTHWADLGSWEYAQSLNYVLKDIASCGIAVHCIGLGDVTAGQKFSNFTKLPINMLYADASGACCDALGFAKGFGPELEISPYLKLLPMLLGISSAGTIPEVLRGYIGDRQSGQIFKGASLFDILGRNYQRPFELATLRLDNMLFVIGQSLCPLDTTLLTQQGGTLLFDGQDVVYEHRDSGILMTPKIEKLIAKLRSFHKDAPLD